MPQNSAPGSRQSAAIALRKRVLTRPRQRGNPACMDSSARPFRQVRAAAATERLRLERSPSCSRYSSPAVSSTQQKAACGHWPLAGAGLGPTRTFSEPKSLAWRRRSGRLIPRGGCQFQGARSCASRSRAARRARKDTCLGLKPCACGGCSIIGRERCQLAVRLPWPTNGRPGTYTSCAAISMAPQGHSAMHTPQPLQ
jgi:hypothetical protein